MKEKGFCFLCLKSSHVSQHFPKKKLCYYFKGMHNSAFSENKSKQGKSKSETSDSLNTIFCLHVKNQLTNFAKTHFDYLKYLQPVDSGSTDEVDL